jgi:hypothetical protein
MIRWLWSNMMKWGWDFNRELRADEVKVRRRGRAISNTLSVCDDDDSPNGIELPDPIHFKVQQVNGGTLIETRWYDYKKDEQRVKLHIVTPEENLSESIGKIVTMELLQK